MTKKIFICPSGSDTQRILINILIIILISTLLPEGINGQGFIYKLTPNGTDPTEIRSRADLYFAQVTSRAGRDLFGSQFSGTYAINQIFSAGIDIPYIYTDLSGGRQGTGIGDIGIRGKVGLYRQKEEQFLRAVSVAGRLLLDTGDADQGTGRGDYALGFTVNASYSLAEEILISPAIETYTTLGADTSSANENDLHLKFLSVLNFEEGIWIGVQPELIIDLTGEDKSSFPLRMIIGYMLNSRFGLSAQYTTFLAGVDRVNYFANVDLRYLF